jgi:predicted metal-dependent hydrolase
MPEIGTPLYTWQQNQLSNTRASLNAKIWKEIAENEGSTIWSEWRVKLSDCVEQKNRAKISNAWEKKYAEFKSYDGMPKRGTQQLNWQQNQLSNGAGSLNAKIREELAENEGSTIWSERRLKLANCVEQKRRE